MMPRPGTRTIALTAALCLLGCNEGLAPTPVPTSCPGSFVGICGTVHFTGAVPDSTDHLYVVAYATFPQSRNDLLTFEPLIPPTLPLDSTQSFYTIPLPNGRYEWVLAVWKKVGTLTVQNADTLLREAGYYRDPADSTKPGVVVVNCTGTDHVDFLVDFSNLHPVSFYFPAPARP